MTMMSAGRGLVSYVASNARGVMLSGVVILTLVWLLSATGARASTGDFCTAFPLGPAGTCWGPVDAAIEETEGWDATDNGVGNCNGIGLGANYEWVAQACIGDGTGYDQVYCTSACGKYRGIGFWPFVHDHSAFYSANFTGWAWDGSDVVGSPVTIAAPDRNDRDAFAVLSRPASAADILPTTYSNSLSAGSFVARFGANIGLARAASGLVAGRVWVIPGDGAVCVVADNGVATGAGADGGAACAADSRAASGGLEFTVADIGDDGAVTLTGVVPNGVASVRAQIGDGASEVLPVDDNVYRATLPGDPVAVSFVAADGRLTTAHT
jgi:hypothetical protein